MIPSVSDCRWTHVAGSTWTLNVSTTIPVYFINDESVVMLDSGYAKDRLIIEEEFQKKRLMVVAIIGSHAHVDHCGNHAFFQKEYSCEIIMPEIEAAMLYDYQLLTAAYAPATAEQIREFAPEMKLHADRVFSRRDKCIFIEGQKFELVPLPGHTPGQTGIVTPDDVFYVGDAIVDEQVLDKSKILSIIDWLQDEKSKEYLKTQHHKKYVLAHSGAHDEIVQIVQKNEEKKNRIAGEVKGWLKSKESWTQNEIAQFAWTNMNLRSKRIYIQTVFLRNLNSVLRYLVETGNISCEFQNGTYFYRCIENERSNREW